MMSVMWTRGGAWLGVAAVACAGWATLARGQDATPPPAGTPPPDASPEPAEPAEVAFRRAVEAFDAGDYAAALARFRASYRLRAAPRVLYNIAVTERLAGRTADACRDLRRYLRDIRELPAARRAEVEQELATWRAQVAELELVIAPGGASLRLDGADVGSSPLTEPLFLDPGEHDVVVERTGFVSQTRALELAAGQRRVLELRLHRAPAPSTRGEVLRPAAAPDAPSRGALASPWLWTAVGAVAVGAVVTAVVLSAGSEPDGTRLTLSSPFALRSEAR